jgi:Mitochondrial K+-H+ exchange-related
VNVYYLSTQDGRRFFYHDASEDRPVQAGEDGSRAAGLWRWAERKWNAVQKTMDAPDGGVTRRIGQAWRWLHSFSHPDETMLTQFGSTDEVALHYPASLPVERVQKAWTRFLKHRSRSHLFWMGVDAVALPFGTLLAVLPGPNVIGFWFLYRAVYHYLAVRGVRRVRRGDVPMRWRAEESLDRPVSHDGDQGPSHEALADGSKLGDYLDWSKSTDSAHGDDDSERAKGQ